MDVVYTLGTGSSWQDREILFSLRSLELVADVERVIIVGQKLPWLKDVVHIAGNDPHVCKERNIMEKVLKACKVAGGPFMFMNDDHFALKQQLAASLPDWRGGDLGTIGNRLRAGSHYRQALLNTDEVLRANGHHTFNFDIHTPIIYDPVEFPKVMGSYDWNRHRGFTVKSLYANTLGKVGVHLGDLKLTQKHDGAQLVSMLKPRPWFSIGPTSITPLLEDFFAAMYPTPSRWEVV